MRNTRIHNGIIAASLACALGCGDPPLAPTKVVADADLFADATVADLPDAKVEADAPVEAEAADVPATPDDSVDAAADPTDAAADAAEATVDAGPVDPCGTCPWHQQPAAPHPGGPGTHQTVGPDTLKYGAGFGEGYKQIRVVKPMTAGKHPVLLFVPGKGLSAGGGLSPQVGQPYLKLLEHVASHGYVAALVQVEQSGLDNDHLRMADDFLAAQAALLDQVSTADGGKLAYAGHGQGAKVALLAAWQNINLDTKDLQADPLAVVLFGAVNTPPGLGQFVDAKVQAAEIVPSALTWFTFVHAADDSGAAMGGNASLNGGGLYTVLQTENKQLLILHGTGGGDPNPATKPELHDDEAAPLTLEGKPGTLADLTIPASHLDALDWYGYWKLLVGALDWHFQKGDPKWAYGDLRTHGGSLPGGGHVTHEIVKQGWKVLP